MHPSAPGADPRPSRGAIPWLALVVATLTLVALLLALPGSGSAQSRPTPCDPPTDAICQATIGVAVFISPGGTTTTGSAPNQSIDITVQWCGPQPFVTGSDTVMLDGAHQSFVFSSGTSTNVGDYFCRYYAESTGTVSITGDGQAHELEARIRDARDSVGDWVERYTYTYQPPTTYGVTVSPQTGTAQRPGGTSAGETFTLANTGNVADSFAVAVTCSGAVSGCGTPPRVTIAGSTTASVTVPYRLAASGSGSIALTATSAHASASGSIAVTATAGAGSLGYANDAGDQTTNDRGLCVKLPAANGGVYECGDLRAAQALPATRVLNQSRAPVLLYSSGQALPVPIVAATLTPSSPMTNVTATVRLSTGQTYSTQYYTKPNPTYPAPTWPAGMRARVAVRWDGSSFATGVYDYTFVVKGDVVGGATGVTLDSVPGRVAIVNRGTSVFGRGWWIAGVEQLVAVTAGKLWIGGDGSTRLYAPTGDGVHWSAPALDRPDTLTLDTIVVSGVAQQVYVRMLPGRARVIFDLSGRHIQTRNALGHVTGFEWNGDQLQHVRLPRVPGVFDPGLTYDFEYANGGGTRLSRVVAPGVGASRVVTVITDASGNNTRIAGPDSTSVQYGYVGYMSSRTDRRGTTSRFSYDGWGEHLAEAVQPLTAGSADDGGGLGGLGELGGPPPAVEAHFYYRAQESAGLPPVTMEPSPVEADTSLSTVFTGADGVETTFWVNRYGAPDSVQDALGHRTRVFRGDPRWPALATSMVSPNGREVTAAYDARGHVVSTTDWATTRNGAFATTSYAWDDYWDKPTRVTQPEGETVTTTYDAFGRPSMIQPGPRASRQTTFTYYPATDARAPGLVASVKSPLVSAETYAYDARGNDSTVTDPAGLVTATLSDAIGRVTTVISPTGAQKRLTYDAADQVVEEESYGAPRTVHTQRGDTTYAEEHLWVHTYRNAEGQPDSIARWQSPDVNGVGRIVTAYVYDVAGRKVLEVAPDSTPATLADNPRDSTIYDLAGRVTGVVTRRGFTITMEYDALGRLFRRTTPGATHGPIESAFSGYSPQYVYFPYFGQDSQGTFTLGVQQSGAAPVTIPAETATFAYDDVGNLVEADNGDAHVTRTWNQNGTLATETQRIRPYLGTDWTKHVYTLGYAYDLDGRRTRLIHPSNISPHAPLSDTTRYAYEPETGALASVTGLAAYTFEYNDAGQLAQMVRGGNVVESFSFDAAGRLSHRTEVAGGLTVHDDQTGYDDATGEVTGVTTLRESVTQARRGLGALSYVTTYNNDKGTRSAEYYGTDPLTNQVYNRIDRYAANQPAISPTVQEDPVFTYEPHTGRLLSTASSGALLNPHEHSWYDAAGNQWFRGSMKPASTPYSGYFIGGGQGSNIGADLRDESAYWYGADDRLYVADRRSCLYFNTGTAGQPLTCDPQRPPSYENRSAFEEYRYDALGRRVLVRTRSEYVCTQYCLNTLRREVWDGDQLLYEISAPGGSSETAARMEADTGLAVPFFLNTQHTAINGFFPYGRVMYEHGGGLDAPLGVARMEFSDILHDAQVVLPLANWRGSYDRGYTLGTCYAYGSNGTFIAPPVDGTPTTADTATYPPGSGGYGGTQYHCVDVDWPGSYTYSALQYRRGYAGPDAWMGSLIFGSRDATGLYYRRNRYYDSDKGRFTQEDPIGLAGGMNVYGFANSDPLTYSDPYGLSKCGKEKKQDPCPNSKANASKPWFEDHNHNTVNENSAAIEAAGQVTGVDARLIRSIMYMETTHGYYDALLAPFDANSSILPMNVRTGLWGPRLGITREQMKNSTINVLAGAEILRQIISDLPAGSTIAQIATRYNNGNASVVSNYGARVAAIYGAQPWLTPKTEPSIGCMSVGYGCSISRR